MIPRQLKFQSRQRICVLPCVVLRAMLLLLRHLSLAALCCAASAFDARPTRLRVKVEGTDVSGVSVVACTWPFVIVFGGTVSSSALHLLNSCS